MTDFIDPNSIMPHPALLPSLAPAEPEKATPTESPAVTPALPYTDEVTFPAHFAWPEPSSEGSDEGSEENLLFDEGPASKPVAMPGTVAQPSAPGLPFHHPGEPQWKTALRRELNAWVDELPNTAEAPEDPTHVDEADEAPDLYHFYEQLTAASADAKKANRRNAEAFGQWTKLLEQMSGELRVLRERMPAPNTANKENLTRKQSLGMVELHDRLRRLSGTFGKTPAASLWGGTSAWQKAWKTQEQGVRILLEHFEGYLRQHGIIQLFVKGKSFDPTTMNAVAVEPAKGATPQTVLEEISPAYQMDGELLRPAQVKVAVG